NATSTHDTKRSEDVRARINVLSEMPAAWARQVRRWSRMTAPLRRDGVPAPNEELLLYQTLVGAWPLDESRLKQYVEKAAREAKAPGVPDFYRGTELWDYSLVDPDNRRPVDYEARASLLRRMSGAVDIATLLRRWHDGRVKLYATWKTLALRNRFAELFRDGDYVPL